MVLGKEDARERIVRGEGKRGTSSSGGIWALWRKKGSTTPQPRQPQSTPS